MTVRLNDGDIVLEGVCGSYDADTLLKLLQQDADAAVDWHLLQEVHTVIVQILMVAQRRMVGAPQSEFIKTMIAPLLIKRSQ